MMDFLKDEEFIKLEKEFKFLSRARSFLEAKHGELGKLTYTIVDLETTGLNPETDEIIEIGAIKLEGGEIKDIFNKLIKPEKPVTQNITDLTGINDEMLHGELPIKPVISKFKDFIGDSILVAHNADFDISFLKKNFNKWLGIELNNPVICTLLISRDILPGLENHKLHTIAKYFHIEAANRHRAIGDAELTYQIWIKLIDKLKDKKVLTRNELESYMSSLINGTSKAAQF